MNCIESKQKDSSLWVLFALILSDKAGVRYSDDATLEGLGVDQKKVIEFREECRKQFSFELPISVTEFSRMPLGEIFGVIFELYKKKEIKDQIYQYLIHNHYSSVSKKLTGEETLYGTFHINSHYTKRIQNDWEQEFGIKFPERCRLSEVKIKPIVNFIYWQQAKNDIAENLHKLFTLRTGQSFWGSGCTLKSLNCEQIDAFEIQTACEQEFGIKFPVSYDDFWKMEANQIVDLIFRLMYSQKIERRLICIIEEGILVRNWGSDNVKDAVCGGAYLGADLGLRPEHLDELTDKCQQVFEVKMNFERNLLLLSTIDMLVASIVDILAKKVI